jgi:biopolymer transport protein ExbB
MILINNEFKTPTIRSILLICLCLPTLGYGAIENDLLQHIERAEKTLQSTERRVGQERRGMSSRLHRLENKVLSLRNKTATARRAIDEQTLSLTQLETRLESWRQQSIYQKNLLNRFIEQHGRSDKKASTITQQANDVVAISHTLERQLAPQWLHKDLIMENGEIISAPTLSVGPVTWFTYDEKAGIATTDSEGQLKLATFLKGHASRAVLQLQRTGSGDITFDPTLSRALARDQHSESIVEHIGKGGLWVIPILAFALFALGIAMIKVFQLYRLPKILRFTPAAITSLLAKNRDSTLTKNIKGMQANLVNITRSSKTASERDDALFMQLQDDKNVLDRWIGAIAITAAVSPLLGLLGTVSGMIETFKMMTLFGSGDPEVVSGGIAQALITTELGLIVAIPALVLNALLSRKAKNYYTELESFAILLSKEEHASQIDQRPIKASNRNINDRESPENQTLGELA